jgi:hypothetical protein
MMQKLKAADFPPPSADLSPLEPVSGSATKEKRRILVVDDDSNSTNLVKILLEKSAASGLRAERPHQS